MHHHTGRIPGVPKKNVPLGDVCPSPKGTFFLGHPVYACLEPIGQDHSNFQPTTKPTKRISFLFF